MRRNEFPSPSECFNFEKMGLEISKSKVTPSVGINLRNRFEIERERGVLRIEF